MDSTSVTCKCYHSFLNFQELKQVRNSEERTSCLEKKILKLFFLYLLILQAHQIFKKGPFCTNILCTVVGKLEYVLSQNHKVAWPGFQAFWVFQGRSVELGVGWLSSPPGPSPFHKFCFSSLYRLGMQVMFLEHVSFSFYEKAEWQKRQVVRWARGSSSSCWLSPQTIKTVRVEPC